MANDFRTSLRAARVHVSYDSNANSCKFQRIPITARELEETMCLGCTFRCRSLRSGRPDGVFDDAFCARSWLSLFIYSFE